MLSIPLACQGPPCKHGIDAFMLVPQATQTEPKLWAISKDSNVLGCITLLTSGVREWYEEPARGFASGTLGPTPPT